MAILNESGGYLLDESGNYLLAEDVTGVYTGGPPADVAGATDSISVTGITRAPLLNDVAGAVDEIHVVQYALPPVPYQNPQQDLTPNPDFQTALGVPTSAGWTATNGTLTVTGSPPAGCPQAFAGQYVNNGSANGAIEAAAAVALVQGIGYLVTAWVCSSAGAVEIGFDWQTAAHAFISTSALSINVPPNMWVQVFCGISGGSSIPSNATFMLPRVGTTSGTLGATVWATQIITTAMAPTYALASPAFVKSTMPRMHVQNLLTGAWLHRDVQGITQPTITWNLNNPDTFACTLGPPRSDLLDSTGNPLFAEWRDAVYLEENDQVKFGGILTNSQFNGPAWQMTATGFAGYATGMPYEGANLVKYNWDALDAVRYIWNWLQAQPGGNLGLMLDTLESGYLVGSNITNLASSTLARNAASGQPNIWLQITDVAAFAAGDRITINTAGYQIKTIVTDTSSNPTGEVTLYTNLAEKHSSGEQVLQVQTWTTLSKSASSGQSSLTLTHSTGFSAGQVILVGTVPYTIKTITTNSSGAPTGVVTLQTNLSESHASGEKVVAAPTPFSLLWYNSTDCGQEIQSIQQEAVFDWHETHAWTDASKAGITHNLHFGVPRIGQRRTDLRFAEGENIVQPVQVTRDGTAFADHVWGIGAGSGTSAVRADSASLAGQRLTRSFVYTDQTVQTQARMSAKVSKVLAAMQTIDAPVTVTIKNHPNAPFGSFSPGDDIFVIMATGWRNTGIWCRITAMSQDPTTSIMTLTVARSDSFTFISASGQGGTI